MMKRISTPRMVKIANHGSLDGRCRGSGRKVRRAIFETIITRSDGAVRPCRVARCPSCRRFTSFEEIPD